MASEKKISVCKNMTDEKKNDGKSDVSLVIL